MGNCCGTQDSQPSTSANRPANLPTTRSRNGTTSETQGERLDLTADGVARACGQPSAAPAQSFEPQQPIRAHFLNKPSDGVGQPLDTVVEFERCRWCCDRFIYKCSDGRLTNIVYGMPKHVNYKAASYVWGATKPLPMQCLSCGRKFSVPMRDKQKFIDLMSFASDGDWMWIDAISIDQNDPVDIADKVARMGDIYRTARYVSVLLPLEDMEAMKQLSTLAYLAASINWSHSDLSYNREPRDHQMQTLQASCQAFFHVLEELKQSLHSFTYWARAWTFQEWAMAADLEVSCENQNVDCILHGLKPLVLQAATMMAIYKLINGQYAKTNLGLSRGQVVQKFALAKQLFPCETAFNAPDTETGGSEETTFQILVPQVGFGRMLGLRCCQPGNPFDPTRDLLSLFRLDMPLVQQDTNDAALLRERVGLALSALSVTLRQARYPADRVASWASMCNIAYDYDRNDSFPEALAKVVNVLRHRYGITIYNFQPSDFNTYDGIDLDFLDYATPQHQANSYDGMTLYPGTPIFTGRTDTVNHIVMSMRQRPNENYPPSDEDVYRQVRRVRGSTIFGGASLHLGPSEWQGLFSDLVSGQYDEISIKDVVPFVVQTVGEMVRNSSQSLVRVQCVLYHSTNVSSPGPEQQVTMWAICNRISQSEKRFVAREETNGQLVLLRQSPVEKVPHIEAYLAITDHQSGTILMRCDDRGFVDIKLQTPMRSDIGNGSLMKPRVLQGYIDLEDEAILVRG